MTGAIDPARLRRLLAPRSIAFVGGRAMARAVRRCRDAGFPGTVHLVNDRLDAIDGERCVASIAELPAPPDACFIATHAESTVDYVEELARAGAGGAICYASGFAEAGEAGRQARLLAGAGAMPVLGPNCYGILNYLHRAHLWPVAFGGGGGDGGAAILTQSGNFAYNVSMLESGLSLSYLISIGNQAQLGFADLIEALLEEPGVTAFGLHMEAPGDPEALARAAEKARARGIPIVALQSGRSELGARIALSHTSSLAGSDEVTAAFFAALGIIRVDTPSQLIDVLTLLQATGGKPARRLGTVVCSGGDAGFIADGCARFGLELPPLEAARRETLGALLPAYASLANPLDFTTSIWASPEALREVCTIVAGQPSVDLPFAVVDYPTELSGERADFDIMLDAVASAASAAGKPAVVASLFGGLLPASVKVQLAARGVAGFDGLERALQAIAFVEGRCPAAGPLTLLRGEGNGPARCLDEAESKDLLSRFGLDVNRGQRCAPEAAETAARTMPGNYVLKVVHPGIAHKSDSGGVILNLATPGEVGSAAEAMVAKLEALHPELAFDTVLVEPMLAVPLAELIIGVARDPVFGLYLVVGGGGVAVELLRDSEIILLPASATGCATRSLGWRSGRC